MILVGNSRGGARNLADHLTKDENDHVTVHELRGFTSDTLHGALNETYAISRGTKCQKFLFSLSLNPPPDQQVETPVFEAAIDRVENHLGLSGQPRAIVFHEKEGRRHAHAVWSRIDAETMTARRMDYCREKMQNVARELYREHSWQMPEGLADRSKSDPRNFTLEQWQQAKRNDRDPREIKDAFADSWAISDSKSAFEYALKERGYWLARGDRRGFTALDVHGEIYSVARWAGVKTKAVRERLGDENDLPSIATTKAAMAQDMDAMLSRLHDEQYEKSAAIKAQHNQDKLELVERQRAARRVQNDIQTQRQQQEQAERQARFRKGFGGLWDRIRGEHKRLSEQNRLETRASEQRSKAERDGLVFQQLAVRRDLNLEAVQRRQEIAERQKALEADKKRYAEMARSREEFTAKRRKQAAPSQTKPRAPPTGRDAQSPSPDFQQAAKAPDNDSDARKRRFMEERKRDRQSRNKDRGGPSLDR